MSNLAKNVFKNFELSDNLALAVFQLTVPNHESDVLKMFRYDLDLCARIFVCRYGYNPVWHNLSSLCPGSMCDHKCDLHLHKQVSIFY